MDVQSAAPHHRFDVVVPDRPSFDSTDVQAATTTAAADDSEALEDHIKEEKEKVE
jgi:hypothetical protein